MAESSINRPDVLIVGGIFREVLENEGLPPDLRLGGSALTAGMAAARMDCAVLVASFVGDEDESVAHELLNHAGAKGELIVGAGASGIFVYPRGGDPDDPRPLFRPAETSPVSLPPLPQPRTLLLFGMPDFDPTRDPVVDALAGSVELLLWDRQGWLSRTRDASSAARLGAKKRILLANAAEADDEGIVRPQDSTICVPAGYAAAVVKKGAAGVTVVEESGAATEVPAYAVDAPNTVGTGDVFAGVLAAEVTRGTSFLRASVSPPPRQLSYWKAGTWSLHLTSRTWHAPALPRNHLVLSRGNSAGFQQRDGSHPEAFLLSTSAQDPYLLPPS